MGVFSRPERRVEDARFITGRGNYVSDIVMEGSAVGYVLRSPYAHARIVSIDIAAALAAPGVAGIVTGQDIEAAGWGHLNCPLPPQMIPNRDGTPRFDGDRTILATDRVRFVGDAVAFVVASSIDQAKEAADLIVVDYEDLPAVSSIAEAIAGGAPEVWPQAKGNISVDWETGDLAAVDAAFAKAAHVVAVEVVNNRIVVNSMEPRGAIGKFDAAAGRYELYATTQGSHSIRDRLAAQILHVPPEKLRVVTPDVGGGFGLKMMSFPEYVVALFAAERLGMPVKWISERGEAFQSDNHGRDLVSQVELAFDADYRILGLRINTDFNVGAYASNFGAAIQTFVPANVIGGAYKVPALYHRARAVFTNTAPVDAYRGAGRPEAAYMIERAMDMAARQFGIGQDEIRLRNFVRPDEMPYKTTAGSTLDSGDFPRNLHDCMRRAHWADFAARRAESKKRGMLRGIGMSYYIEQTMSSPGAVEIAFEPDGRVRLAVGTSSHGQGHETTFAQIVSDQLGVPISAINFVQGDTDRGVSGGGTGGSRSLWASGNGALKTCASIIDKGKAVVAELTKSSPDSVDFQDGAFHVRGTNRFMPLDEVVEAARRRDTLSPALLERLENGLDTTEVYDDIKNTYPNGCHIAEVEIDPETGKVTVADYNVVDDFGFVLNAMIVRGQVHGGIAQGIGQALLENCLYEPGTAQLISGSFMDYCMPRADDFPPFSFAYNEVLCTTNPLGVKGCGEAGTIGACPAVINAVLDALWAKGVRRADMPMTALRVWEALQAAESKN